MSKVNRFWFVSSKRSKTQHMVFNKTKHLIECDPTECGFLIDKKWYVVRSNDPQKPICKRCLTSRNNKYRYRLEHRL